MMGARFPPEPRRMLSRLPPATQGLMIANGVLFLLQMLQGR